MAQNTGAQVVQYAQESGVMRSTLDYHISTGLSRPDFYDWPRRLAYVARVLQPDAAVAFFGANDAQAVDFNGRVLDSGSPAWDALYGQRVGQAMDTLLRGGATRVYWVGLPIMGSTAFSRAVAVLDTIYRREAAARPGSSSSIRGRCSRLPGVPTPPICATRTVTCSSCASPTVCT